jgi:trk system potassium uptake protein TrkH
MCAMSYWAAGMHLFDAVGHAFSTVATGGFSTHDSSLGYFDNPVIEAIAIVFMLAGGVTFAVHFAAMRRQSIQPYVGEPEVRSLWWTFVFAAVFLSLSLMLTGVYATAGASFRHGTFQVASVLTSTGFTTATFSQWPLYIPMVLVTLSFIGGCVGSTAGGIKIMRVLLLFRIGRRELFHLAHPQSVSMVVVGKEPVPEDVLYSVMGFFVLYMVSTLVLTAAMTAAGLDLETAFGAVLATINLLGPGLGEVSNSFASMSPAVKWLAMCAMLIGRLEVFTLLILLLPAYWRH